MRGRELDDLALPAVPAGLPSELLERRPDLRQAEQDLIAANALIGAARALYFPSISLTGLFGSASGQFSSLFTGPARVWSYAGAVTLPIFTAGSIGGQVKQAEAQQQQALFQYQKAIQVAFQEVATRSCRYRKRVSNWWCRAIRSMRYAPMRGLPGCVSKGVIRATLKCSMPNAVFSIRN